MTKRLNGLDGEMGDSALADGAVLVQIGVAFYASERISAILGWPGRCLPLGHQEIPGHTVNAPVDFNHLVI